MSEDKVRRSSFLTPCRSVGLKRRSTGTPSPAQNSPKTLLVARDSEGSSCTSKRVKENVAMPICRRPKILKTFSTEDEKIPALKMPLPKDENEEKRQDEEYDCSVETDTKQLESSPLDLEKQILGVESRLNKLKDDIRNLESVSLNAKQHDTDELNKLIRKWRDGCQQALNDLLIEYKDRDNSYTMSSLLSSLGIPSSLVHYSETETDFYV